MGKTGTKNKGRAKTANMETDRLSRALQPEAERALAEAAARRQKAAEKAARPAEHGGRQGPDPVRYGDWEKDGIISDF